jgi:hypothetical protein
VRDLTGPLRSQTPPAPEPARLARRWEAVKLLIAVTKRALPARGSCSGAGL